MKELIIEKGKVFSHFYIDQIEYLEEYEGYGIRGHHLPTGLEFFHLYRDDKENLFSFNFFTLPKNDCGIPHIIEHSVLSGSKKFPLKDPFQAFFKGSVYTFLNAMTGSDTTLFPAASVLPKDYFNLMSLYGDAVFHPLLTREIFEQEACRIEIDKQGQFYPKGVVFNEMKGALSDNEEKLYLNVLRGIFAESEFQYYSGGIPKEILKLRYEEFLEFYQTHYQPSNCKLFLYGDIETERQLEFLDKEILNDLPQKNLKNCFFKEGQIKRWEKPKSIHFSVPAASAEKKLIAGWSWLLPKNGTMQDQLLKNLVFQILLGDNGSPLHRALIDSGLGEDLAPNSATTSEFGFALFSYGLRGVNPENISLLEKKLIDLLQEIVQKGIPSDVIEGFLRRFEFSQRNPSSSSPEGLRVMELVWKLWKHGKSPFEATSSRATLKAIRKLFETTPHFFETWIEENLLNNPHRLFFVMTPDPNETIREEEILQKALEEKLVFEQKFDKDYPASRLKIFYDHQNKEESPEVFTKIPKLVRSDFDVKPQRFPIEIDSLKINSSLINYRCSCNEIVYGSIFFDVADLSFDEKLLLPTLLGLMKDSATNELTLEQVNRRIGLYFGFVDADTLTTGKIGEAQGSAPVVLARFHFALLQERATEGLRFFFQLLLDSQLNDKKRLIDYIRNERNSFKSDLVPDSIYFAQSLTVATFSESEKITDVFKGLGQYAMAEYLFSLMDSDLDALIADLESLRLKILNPARISFRLIHSDHHSKDRELHHQLVCLFNDSLENFSRFSQSVPNPVFQNYQKILKNRFSWFNRFPSGSDCSIYTLPTDVSYNCIALKAPEVQSEFELSVKVLSKLLSFDFLWNKVRLQGGAYGVSTSFSPLDGYFLFSSYRDPALTATFENYRHGLEFYAKQPASQREIDEVVITLLGKELRKLVPSHAGAIAYMRYLTGTTDEIVQSRYEQLKAVTPSSVQQAAKWLLEQWNQAAYLSFTSSEKLKREQKKLEHQFQSNLTLFSIDV